MNHGLDVDLRPEEHVELLVADLSLARAFYAGIPAARLLARMRLATDERDLQAKGSKPGSLSWDALLHELLNDKDDAALERVKRAVARHTRAAAAEGPLVGEAYLAFGPTPEPCLVFNLSATGDIREAAANLFAMLRAADRLNPRAIAVAPIPEHGLGEAINDRLRRAAGYIG